MNNKFIAQELVSIARDLTVAPREGKASRVAKESRIDIINRIIDEHQYEKIDGQIVDATTASMLKTVYDALKPASQKKFDRIPLRKLVDFGWSMGK